MVFLKMSGNINNIDNEDLWGTWGFTKGQFCFMDKTSAKIFEIFCKWCKLKTNILKENFLESKSIYENA